MTNNLPANVLDAIIKVKTRVTVMASYEGTTDVPEHAHLKADTTLNWDVRARGLGGDMELPLTSCAEENILAYQIDKYHAEELKTYDPDLYKHIGQYFPEFTESPSKHTYVNLYKP